MRKVRTAVFPVGGLGTRFLPATKAMPKEMLPVVDRPLIQYAVDEAVAAGIEQMIFVTGRGKNAIEDHFDRHYELESTLGERGKSEVLAQLEGTRFAAGTIAYVRQREPLGLGHAVWCARHLIGDNPFAVLLPDELLWNPARPCLKAMIEAHAEVGGNVIGVLDVPREHTHRYGIVSPGAQRGALTEVLGLVEKPKPADAPSTMAAIGRYILEPAIMDKLEARKRGAGGEIQLTDAMAELIGGSPFHALPFEGTRYDCGDKAGYVTANIALALERADIGPEVRAWIDANVR
ncbi:UTP--glucose-1-phosphate uridylyltransferase GalU [Sphingosinicella sp.]|jgi:UTP--glucose-1-phosphate uridylyltransferase|uniref:UTP--glucose-1-phosphate uridylyltransferase GalU n=1 Tax=Sphingosinicella sp. TaxID=1917971 RepID=UPI0017E07452|nr:UTP--glucose-1-phosphate uridylyltransferase GalU [Sphingosinicella sp.]MBA4759831.1 UTP--glucose-1-phosphate uridylyltransferase GalU [Sphingosinicella sp.]MEA3539101.1 UTP--glucose-1-phosphate uridylyltransferase GalU [Pseudomonadota bacterium]